MILDRLELNNFKRFRHQVINFHDGITGILGNNGTGKSSLVTAIFFALYGVQATGIAADYIVSSFAGQKEKCEVRLDFRIGGDTYTVVRTFKKGKTVTHDASFHKNNKMMATGVSPVETEVKRTLGMGPVDFKNTIYAGQKDLLTLLENTPGKRKEWFLRALGIDYLSTESQKVLKEDIDKKTGELQRKEGELAAMSGRQSEGELANLQASITTFTTAIAELGKQKTDLTRQRAELDAQLRVLAEKKAAYDRLVQQQLAIKKELATETAQQKTIESGLVLLRNDEAEYHELEKAAGSYAEIRARLDTLAKQKAEHQRITGELGFCRKQVADINARIGKEKTRLAGLAKDAEEYTRLAATIRKSIGAGPELADDRLDTAVNYQVADLMKRAGTLAAQQQRYKEEKEKLEADRATIAQAGPDGICPLCRQKLGAHFGDLEQEFGSKLREMEDKAVADLERQERLEKEKTAIEALRPVLEQLRTLAAQLKRRAEFESAIAELTTQLSTKQREEHACAEAITNLAFNAETCSIAEQQEAAARKVQARFTELGKKIGQANSMKQQLADLVERIAKRNADLAKREQEITGAPYNPTESAGTEDRMKATDTALRDADVAIANAARDKKFAEEKIADYKRTTEQIVLLQKQATELKDEIDLLRLTRSLIAEYVVYLMQVVRSRLEGEVSRIIAEITGGRYEQVLLDEDFNLLVRDVDNDYPIDRFSGGEQDDIAVALRIALSRYLAELHQVHESTFLIFDEIFGSQDEERRNNLLTALRTQESRFPQILLISHIAEMQGEFANTLQIEMGADNASRIKEVE
ncbi:SMC family ATPase [Methanoregula sp.]|uniref:AAA family ATPase n=1 Tax=Methanoregula sp. TaxID=2052170 RepID=UPI00236991C7|nr:SMC family ATPase [Methanoregula sp.]MDD1686417.1 SMC family ATPase [Methanoregula sp.]